MDNLTPEHRRRTMASVKSADTSPELHVRRLVHSLGYRYRLYRADLPGKPDLVFPSRRKIIFIHGCFWHRHACSQGRSMPASNKDQWAAKFTRNMTRDRRVRRQLRNLGWGVLVLWECWISRWPRDRLANKITSFLDA